jgi:hypothetical protein
MRRFFAWLAALLGLAVLTACNSGGTITPFGPPASVHLYVSDRGGAGGHIYVFTLPVSGASTPGVTVSGVANPWGIGLSATQLFVPNSSTTTMNAYALPLTNASTPAFSFTMSHNAQDVAINSAGNLYAAESFSSTCCIEAVNGPLSGASTPAFTMTLASAGGFPFGVGFDPSGNLFATGASQVAEFMPTFSGASTPAFHFGSILDNEGIVSDAMGRIFVANGPSEGKIDVYTPPYANASTPTFTITASTHYIGFPVFDSSGNLYVPVTVDNKVYVFTPPFSGASTPAFSISVTGAYGAATGP